MNTFFIKKIITLLLFLVSPVFAQMEISVGGGVDYFVKQAELKRSGSFYISARFLLNEHLLVGGEYRHLKTEQQLETPASQITIPFLVNDFNATVEYIIFQSSGFFTLRPVLFIGAKHMQRSASHINAGALGLQKIEGAKEIFVSAGIGLNIQQKISNHLALFISPKMAFYDYQNPRQTLSIIGGINATFF